MGDIQGDLMMATELEFLIDQLITSGYRCNCANFRHPNGDNLEAIATTYLVAMHIMALELTL
jgi:hypothetical protein